ncbi:hypothetical protein IWQ61_007223 [Dispira simplex]|nr:hypothetical protein IWQ61_009792 [Dispira simplex]KAJ1652435.1 hypothetical protein IWQ61_007223 [Dispira simplex]
MNAFAARSLITRGAFARQRLLRSAGHHEHMNPVPFNTDNKGALAAKVILFTATGFGLPFFVAWYHLRDSA